jgi:predicted helicase
MSLQLIQQYHTRVDKIIQYGGSRNESALRFAFQTLLEQYCADKNLELIAELEHKTKYGTTVYPDGTLKDALRQPWGYWESKDQYDTLDEEIQKKFDKGYPTSNILFEDSQTIVLIQGGQETARTEIKNPTTLHALLTAFVSYEPPEVQTFRAAIERFKEDLPDLVTELRHIIEEQAAANPAFVKARDDFLELCKEAINPYIVLADIREMIIQHILTEDIFITVFGEDQFHRENNIARELQQVISSFFKGTIRRNIHKRMSPYVDVIKAAASNITNHHEKQRFLKVVYENFYKTYNPAGADRLGIVYTPNEIVHFIIEAADYLVHQHFGRLLADQDVEILDPATGTGTFITELIEYLPKHLLPYKYKNEIHCNEVAILPYYVANLNIEYTYAQKMGHYAEFENICFVDTLDNLGFGFIGKQGSFFDLSAENLERIKRQNDRKISVIIGNPPYNANQLNENENNKNRAYPGVDKRIKDTYIKHSTAQKTKSYDMYTRFLRWASDRLDKNGIVAFVLNNSFIDARTHDGLRKVVANEFNEIYIIDLKGNARTSGERRRREGGNVFSDEIRVGVAVYFLVRKEGVRGCKIFYNTIGDYVRAEAKKAYLRNNKFKDLPFEHIQPDKKHNWINLADNDEWDELLPVGTKGTKLKGSQADAIFRLYSLGVVTARDEWVYDIESENLEKKIRFFYGVFQNEKGRWEASGKQEAINDFVDRTIKWTSELEDHLMRGSELIFDEKYYKQALYRPFVKRYFYFDHIIIHRPYQQPDIFRIAENSDNIVICINVGNKPFNVLVTNVVPDYHFNGDSQCLPLYRYNELGNRVDNITAYALKQFQEHYDDETITRLDIFHYVYAVLHHPAYREKYKLNLKREFPRIPFYDDFWQWATWGQSLMELHLNYETVAPYPLQRVDKPPHPDKPPVTPAAKLKADKTAGTIELDTVTTLKGIPAAWDYKLGNRSALEWVLEYHKERKPRDPTIRDKFNTYRLADYKEQVIELLQRVCTVSVETMRIIGEMGED